MVSFRPSSALPANDICFSDTRLRGLAIWRRSGASIIDNTSTSWSRGIWPVAGVPFSKSRVQILPSDSMMILLLAIHYSRDNRFHHQNASSKADVSTRFFRKYNRGDDGNLPAPQGPNKASLCTRANLNRP
jgi:hypothetical protein